MTRAFQSSKWPTRIDGRTSFTTSPKNRQLRFIAIRLQRLAAVVIGLFAIYLFTWTVCYRDRCSEALHSSINSLGQLILLFCAIYTSVLLIRRDTNTLWTPAVAYPMSIGLFYGFGNMSTIFADPNSISLFLSSNYGITSYDLTRANLLTTLGVFASLITMSKIISMKNRPNIVQNAWNINIKTAAKIFLLFGLIIKYAIILPAEFGNADITLPGAMTNLSFLADIGFALAMHLSARGERTWTIIFWLLWPPYLALGILEFQKKVVLMAILLPAIGAYMAHNNYRRTIPWLLAAMISFSYLQSINTYGRLAIFNASGNIEHASLNDRLEILQGALFGDQLDLLPTKITDGQIWWFRLNYAGAQIRAMEQYDSGQGGDWYQSPLVYFIPRLLWPNKPEIVSPGQIFNRSISGNDSAPSHVGMSVYADGYWQYGWFGVILFSSILGLIFGIITVISYNQITRENYIYLPAIFLGINLSALGHTGYLQNSIFGGFTIYIGYLLLISIAMKFINFGMRPNMSRIRRV